MYIGTLVEVINEGKGTYMDDINAIQDYNTPRDTPEKARIRKWNLTGSLIGAGAGLAVGGPLGMVPGSLIGSYGGSVARNIKDIYDSDGKPKLNPRKKKK